MPSSSIRRQARGLELARRRGWRRRAGAGRRSVASGRSRPSPSAASSSASSGASSPRTASCTPGCSETVAIASPRTSSTACRSAYRPEQRDQRRPGAAGIVQRRLDFAPSPARGARRRAPPAGRAWRGTGGRRCRRRRPRRRRSPASARRGRRGQRPRRPRRSSRVRLASASSSDQQAPGAGMGRNDHSARQYRPPLVLVASRPQIAPTPTSPSPCSRSAASPTRC